MHLALATEELHPEMRDRADREQARARRADRRDDAEHAHLEEKLPNDAPAAGAEGGADGELALATECAGENDVGDVRAREEENETRGAEEDPEGRRERAG